MKLKLLSIMAIWLCTMSNSYSQCLNGGCEVGLSRSEIKNGVFIGHYENGEKLGLGINYIYNPKGLLTSYAEYIGDKRSGVEYQQFIETGTEKAIHTFKNYSNGTVIYPAFRISKENKKTKIEVAFNEISGWQKYDGDKTLGELSVKGIIHDGSPAFIALNGKDQVMAISATVGSISLLSSETKEKYYNALQLNLEDDRLTINIFPKAGADETFFRTNIGWDMQKPEEGTWIYKRYFNNELSYKFTYEDVLELPSQKDVKEQKLQKAFDYVADQVEEYDFEKGYDGKAKDFIDMLKDIKERAERSGLDISNTYDLTMIRLYLQIGDEDNILKYALSACIKSSNSYTLISDLITTNFKQHEDLLPLIKKNEGIASSSD
ncbi:hypothetical protein ACFO3O_21475 [Dokdonia ponticola]|uniref:DUF4476 domain-containing protein n=1 Tax=Dokdonia ponticola TaxID=2041041 RepID=A0ABV9I256_9FLAO